MGAGHHRQELPFSLAPETRGLVPKEEQKGRARDASKEASGPFSFGHTRGAAPFCVFFTGGISPKIEIEK